jgi:hypothetical protein
MLELSSLLLGKTNIYAAAISTVGSLALAKDLSQMKYSRSCAFTIEQLRLLG